MLTALRNNKSLTFYQTTEFRPKCSVDSSYTGGITATAISSTAYTTATVTTQFNNQLNAFLDAFHAERERIANKVAEGLAKDSEYTGARNDAVIHYCTRYFWRPKWNHCVCRSWNHLRNLHDS